MTGVPGQFKLSGVEARTVPCRPCCCESQQVTCHPTLPITHTRSPNPTWTPAQAQPPPTAHSPRFL